MIFFARVSFSLPPTGGGIQKGATKTLRVMKLTALILLIVCLQVSAHGVAQDKITFSGEDVTLEKIFSVIKKQTSYLFLYNDALLKNARKVTLHVKKASVEEVLNTCFKDQPFNFTIKGKTIFIVNKQVPEKKEEDVMTIAPPEEDIKGRITNAQGEPLSGANIVVKRTGRGTQANANGEFMLKNVGSEEMITITYTGYAQQTVKMGGRKNLILVMQVTDNELDEMIVQAYGTTTRRLATGNIAKVTAAEIERQPVMNPLLALQGRVPGLDVKQINGFASAPIKVELRGRKTIGDFPSDPLYIIDGVPLTIMEVGSNSGYSTGSTGFLQNGLRGPAGGQSPLFSINPGEIESIEVLKDADATSIYGSRAANGVILITTKKGKIGKTKFDIHLQEGISRVTRFWDMLNTEEYLLIRREAYKNDNKVPNASDAYDLLTWDQNSYTDWQKALYNKSGKTYEAQIGLSGGDSRNTFRISATYNNSKNILTVSGADQRASVSANFSHRSSDHRFMVSFTSNQSFTKSDMVSLPGKVTYAPNAPAIFDSLGNLNFTGWGGSTNNSFARRTYPFSSLKQPYTATTNFLINSLQINYQPFKGVKINANLGYNSAQANQEQLNLIASKDPLTNPTGDASWGYNTNKNWIIEPNISYDKRISKGYFNFLVGGTYQRNYTSGIQTYGYGYTSDDLIKTISNAPGRATGENIGEYRYAALFARITYNWGNKYILNLTARRDGSSRFGPGKQYGNFGSIGSAWIFTEERWFKNKLKFISFGKLRSSYGTTGSDAVGDYQFLTRWSSNNIFPYNNTSALVPIQHFNPDYQWQVNKKFEAAIDLGFFKDRLKLSISYYRDRCGNQLISFPTPVFTGFTNVNANSPALVQNTGLEFVLGANIISSKNFSWSLNLNASANQNKLVTYPNFELSPYVGQYVIGKPLNIVKLLQFTGVDPLTGKYTAEDKNHDGQITTDYSGKEDDTYMQEINPNIFGGLSMNFSYKSNLQVSLFFNFKKQTGINAYAQGDFPGTLTNQPATVLARWQKSGEITQIARVTTLPTGLDNVIRLSDFGYTDASFIRFSNISVSYSLPKRYISKTGMQNCNLFLHANNLFVITKYKGIDPETQNFGSLPPIRTLVLGLSFYF